MSGRRRLYGINPISQSCCGEYGYSLTHARQRRQLKKRNLKVNTKPKNESKDEESVGNLPEFKQISREVISTLKMGKTQKSMSEAEIREICIELLNKCEASSPSVLEIDEWGYDLVQHIVGKGDVELFKYIKDRNFSIALNERKCSSLLHIACSKGSIEIINLLLDMGADVTLKASKCFPSVKHYTLKPKAKEVVCNYKCVGCCRHEKGQLLCPLEAAVESDNFHVIKALLSHPKVDPKQLSNLNILRFACEKGTVRSLPFLVEIFSSEINYIDECDRSLVRFAFRSSEKCGMTFLQEAMKYGLDKKVLNFQSDNPLFSCNDTVLHYIYWLDTCIRFMDITNLVIAAGFEVENLRKVDRDGNNLLHTLMMQMGKRLPPAVIKDAVINSGSLYTESYEEVVQCLENEKEKHIFATLDFLIEHGVDKNATAANCEGILHKLLHNCVYLNITGFGTFMKLLPQIIKVTEYLCRHGLDLSHSAQYVSTPMNYVIHTISSFQAAQIDTIWHELWYLFTIFLKYESDPNIADRRGVSNVSIILTTLHRWINYCINHPSEAPPMTREKDLPIRTIMRVQDLFYLFFQYGLAPRHDVLELSCKQIAILCNINYSDKLFLVEVKNLFKPFFLNGVNPNSLRMITEGNSEYDVPCQLHAQFYLARAFMIHYHSFTMFQFFQIFTNTLDQVNFNSLLVALCTILQENFDKPSYQEQCGVCVKNLMLIRQVVRPLKTLTRIAICNGLSWKIEQRKTLLPLPKILQEYLTLI